MSLKCHPLNLLLYNNADLQIHAVIGWLKVNKGFYGHCRELSAIFIQTLTVPPIN